MSRPRRLAHYGWPISHFSGKTRSYLNYKGIDFDEVRVALSQPVIDRGVEEMNERGADGNALLTSARRLTEKYNQ